LIQAGDIAIYSEIHKKLISSVCKKKEVPQRWKSITVTVYEKGNKKDFINYYGTPLLSATY